MKHSNNGDIRFNHYNKFVQSFESPSDRDLVGSHIGVYISNPNNSIENAIILAKDTDQIKLEVTFYRHSTNEPITKDYILKYMNYLEELLPNELINHNLINNQFNLVCNNIDILFVSTTQTLLRLQ